MRIRFRDRPRSGARLRPLAAILVLTLGSALHAQSPVIPASPLADYLRVLELQGRATGLPLVYQSASTTPRAGGLTVDTTHLWAAQYRLAARPERPSALTVRWLDTQAEVTYNSAFPRTLNDGAAWAGKGASATLRGGVDAAWGPFTARLNPTLVYAENRAFRLGVGPASTDNPYAYPWKFGIDFPQRLGKAALTRVDWGQSAIRADVGAFTVGLSTENLWWGPGYRNAIIMGSAAPGFPHVDLGTGRALHTRAGDLEFRAIWGQLERSDFASASTTDGRRILNGLTAGYRPSFLPGLTLGATRVLYHRWPPGGLRGGDLFDAFGVVFNPGHVQPDGSFDNDTRDQLASVTARWAFPEVGFETYLEYARNDFAADLTDLFLQPDNARGYTIGFQKVLTSDGGSWVLKGEQTNLHRIVQAGPSFYAHNGHNPEGYTHRGQLLGASIGPGSNAQYLGLDHYTRNGRAGLFVERIRYDDDYSFDLAATPDSRSLRQTDLTLGVHALRFVAGYDLGGRLEWTHQFNRYFVRSKDVSNLALTFSLTRHAP